VRVLVHGPLDAALSSLLVGDELLVSLDVVGSTELRVSIVVGRVFRVSVGRVELVHLDVVGTADVSAHEVLRAMVEVGPSVDDLWSVVGVVLAELLDMRLLETVDDAVPGSSVVTDVASVSDVVVFFMRLALTSVVVQPTLKD